MAIKFGTKACTVLATAVFSLALVAGCNSDEPAPDAGAPPKAPGATPPGKAPEVKSTPAPTPPPPVTAPDKGKDEGKPKP